MLRLEAFIPSQLKKLMPGWQQVVVQWSTNSWTSVQRVYRFAQLGQDPFAEGQNMKAYWCQSILANLSCACYLTTYQFTPIWVLCKWQKKFFLHALLAGVKWNDSFNWPGDHILDIETLSLHWSFIPSCISCWCSANWPFELAWWSHSPHGNFIPWCIYLC